MEAPHAKLETKKKLYQHIANQGIVSKIDLLASFTITTSTMNRLLEDLLADGLIQESGRGSSTGGRKPILFEINPHYGYIIGLEISRFYSSLGLFDMQLNAKSLVRWRMDEDMTPGRFVAHVAQQIRALLKDHDLTQDRIISIGIGAVGPLDRARNMILKPLHFRAQGWSDVPICQLIEEACGIPAILDNGANTALIGEHWALRQEQPQHMLYVHAGVSLRSAMMSQGRIIHGSVDMEGSIGQMIIQKDGPRLQDTGNYGALEAFVSVLALEKQAQTRDNLRGANYDSLLRELSRNNPVVQGLFLEAAGNLGIGLANLINSFHPETIILGGVLISSHESFYSTAIETAIANTYYYPEYTPVFSKGALKEDAVAAGAALMAREHFTF
ncbi:ROK family protein [Paenibacillus sp. BC26]|uniref:ROK family protein n=1 Tax=Paenibacillus sp. BC26 TaxID=1881032 RepID=UPI0008E31ACA|nr:ROK family protein [Paenibacillus sp. BC26]SFS45477.1 Sugar kinase of the NBD/HSP70 family, may contain an N-terminal HTH domain [Paenibacillus sp. BC26]